MKISTDAVALRAVASYFAPIAGDCASDGNSVAGKVPHMVSLMQNLVESQIFGDTMSGEVATLGTIDADHNIAAMKYNKSVKATSVLVVDQFVLTSALVTIDADHSIAAMQYNNSLKVTSVLSRLLISSS